MPVLERFMKEGCSGNISTLYPVLSPMLWTSIATGKRAWKHGIHGFTEPNPIGTGIRPITNLSRKTKAVWNILNQNGYRCNVVGWWPSHPAEPIDGVMISNHYQSFGSAGEISSMIPKGAVHPEHLVEKLLPLRLHPSELDGEAHLRPFVPRANEIDQKKDQRLYSIAKILCDCTNVHAAATALLQNEPADFMAVYYDAIDHFGHGFMKFHPPRCSRASEEDFELYKGVVEGAYRYHDMMLGTLLTLVGNECTVILMSDHGFHPDHLRPEHIPVEPAGPAQEHRHYGIFAMKGPDIRKGVSVSGVGLLDISPTILKCFGLAVGEDMDGAVIREVFVDPIDVNKVPSWDLIEGPKEDGRHQRDQELDPLESQAVMEQMIALGYIAEPGSDQSKNVDECKRELRYNLARAHMDGGFYEEALSSLQQLWEDWPNESRFGLSMIRCQLALGDTANARLILKQVKHNKQRYSIEAKAALEMLNTELKSKKTEDITASEIRRFRELKSLSSFNPGMFEYIEAVIYLGEKHFARALSLLEEAETKQFNPLPLHFRKGECHFELNQYSEAEASFEKVLELDGDHCEARLGLAMTYLKMRRNFDAAAHALEATRLQYRLPEAHYLYGTALHRIGQLRYAESALKTCIDQNPFHHLAHKRLAYMYERRLQKPELAVIHQKKAKEALIEIRKKRNPRSDCKVNFHDEGHGFSHPGKHGRRIGKRGGFTTDSKDIITIVSGLPRSGTSMMMQILERGGMECLVDDQRKADIHNPKGYYEYEPVKFLHQDASWMSSVKGKVLKVVAPLLPYLPDGYDYRIIFMVRDLDAVVDSQQRMIQDQRAFPGMQTRVGLKSAYAKQIRSLEKRFADDQRVAWVYYEFEAFFKAPDASLEQLNSFLESAVDMEKAASVICPGLCHSSDDKTNGKTVNRQME